MKTNSRTTAALRSAVLPLTLSATTLLGGCAAAIPLLINAAAADPKGTADLAKSAADKLKSLAPSAAASAPAEEGHAIAKAGITRTQTPCTPPATTASGNATEKLSPAAKAAAGKLASANKVGQVTQIANLVGDATSAAKNSMGAIDGTCVTLRAGQGRKNASGEFQFTAGRPTFGTYYTISAPQCGAVSIAGDAAGQTWQKFKAAVGGTPQNNTPAATQETACAADKKIITEALDAAGKQIVSAYRTKYKVPAGTPVAYTISGNTPDLSAVLTDAALGVAVPQINRGAGAAVQGAFRELKK